MSWHEEGDLESKRTLPDGRVAIVFAEFLVWRAIVDDRLVDDFFFDKAKAMQAIEDWAAGRSKLNFHPTEKRWYGNDAWGYARESADYGEIEVIREKCGNWRLNIDKTSCFCDSESARRHADTLKL